MQTYTIHDLAQMTGFTTRKLRYDLKLGLLAGEKENGAWTFTQEEYTDYITHPSIQPALRTKRHGIVYDFLAEEKRKEPRLCLILDDAADENLEDLMAQVNRLQSGDRALRFAMTMQGRRRRLILEASPEDAAEFLRWYGE